MAYAIVTFGRPSYGNRRSFYRSLDSAERDLRTLGGGSMSSARIVECATVAAAKAADISDRSLTVIASR
ncbi:MAG: hypothetical protein GY772_21775 [bacterium]|nr:hypothetical protein [bacterium]